MELFQADKQMNPAAGHCRPPQTMEICLMTDEQHSAPDSARIDLTPEEAIVLFELLSRWCEDNNASTPEASCFESTAEGAVLHRLLAELEKQLAAPFTANYDTLLGQARDRLKRNWDYKTLRG